MTPQALKDLREQLRISQHTLAYLLRVTEDDVENWETNRYYKPTSTTKLSCNRR